MEKHQRYPTEIVDVFFGMKNYGSLSLLVKMKDLQKRENSLALKAENSGKNFDKDIEEI